MREVRIDKGQLAKVLHDNRAAHRGVYEKAFDGYTKAAIRFFEKQLALAREGERFQPFFQEPMPEDHTADYDTVIEMLNMSEDDVITLTQGEFRQYVKDEWGWKREFLATSANYVGENGEYPR